MKIDIVERVEYELKAGDIIRYWDEHKKMIAVVVDPCDDIMYGVTLYDSALIDPYKSHVARFEYGTVKELGCMGYSQSKVTLIKKACDVFKEFHLIDHI